MYLVKMIKLSLIIFANIFSSYGQDTAEKKCHEYGKLVYQVPEQQLFSPRAHLQDEPHNISGCAIFDNPLIIGGTRARAKEFPHMAVIGYGAPDDLELDWVCGGSLISENHILTAAHCTSSIRGDPQRVRLGTINLDDNDDYVQEKKVEKFVNHPSFKKPNKYHDIAILFIKEKVIFSEFVRPICLNIKENIPYEKAIATGFGKTSMDDEAGNKELLKVELNIIPKSACTKYMQLSKIEAPRGIIEQMLCAGDLEGNRDTCQGDSGGPLQVLLDEPYCMYCLIGITSFGKFCGMAYSPAIYTKIDQYIPWIEATIWK